MKIIKENNKYTNNNINLNTTEENESFKSNDITITNKSKDKKGIYFFIIIFLLCIIITDYFIFFKFSIIKTNLMKKQNLINDNLTQNISTNIPSLKILKREEALNIGLPFIKKCIEGILIINNTKYKRVKNPKISVVIPCYNCAQYLKASLRSIQNQDMNDIEIIIVNDNSNNETTNLIKQLEKEDERIKVYNNKKNMKLLYTRSLGVLKSGGKYVVTLDADDMFLDSDVFDVLYTEAEDGNFDIISYRIFEANDYYERNEIKEHIYNNKSHNLKIYQPELSCYVISSNDSLSSIQNDINIWGKLFRTSVYKSAINLISDIIYTYPILWDEDVIMLYTISNVASSYKYIRKYGYFHYVGDYSVSNSINKNDKAYSSLIKLNIELKLCKQECCNIPAMNLIKDQEFFKKVNEDESKNYLIKVINKILHKDNIDIYYKNEIKNLYQEYRDKSNTF